jgi:hypothetical protein
MKRTTEPNTAEEANIRPWYTFSGSSPLSVTHKSIARNWHPHKNGNFTPGEFTYGSNEKVWWFCRVCQHAWDARILDRTLNKSGCPCCAGKVATPENNLKVLFPDVAAQWHPKKNGKLKPEAVLPKSNQKVWWQCPKEKKLHDWEASVSSRTANASSCPFCSGNKPSPTNSLATLFPELAEQWHPTKNGDLTPADVTCGSKKLVWWDCPEGPDHVFQSEVRSRTKSTSPGAGCPMCHGLKVSVTNSLVSLFPEVAAEWHRTKNDLSVKDVVARSPRRVWWKCSVKPRHHWIARIQDRTQKMSGCPECVNKKPRLT